MFVSSVRHCAGKIVAIAVFCGLLTALPAERAQSAIPPERGYWNLLVTRYQASSENYAEALVEEFFVFRDLYPRFAGIDSLEYLLADVYTARKRDAEAMATYLKLLYVYPGSPLAEPARQRLDSLARVEKRGLITLFGDDNMDLLKRHVLNRDTQMDAMPGGEKGYLDWLLLLGDARIDALSRYLINECRHYLYRLDYGMEAARVYMVMGEMYQLEKRWRNALLAYRTAQVLDPFGPNLGDVLLEAAEVYLRELENYEMAQRVYNEIVEKYPAEMVGARASLMISEVQEAREDYAQAIIQLEDTAKRFPFPEIRMDCYTRIARIYLERMDSPPRAVEYYERLVDEFPGETRALETLIRIGEVHERKTKNHAGAVEAYRRIASMFPESPLAPKYLFRAAELADKELDDGNLAAELYARVAEQYPDTEYGRDAAGKIR